MRAPIFVDPHPVPDRPCGVLVLDTVEAPVRGTSLRLRPDEALDHAVVLLVVQRAKIPVLAYNCKSGPYRIDIRRKGCCHISTGTPTAPPRACQTDRLTHAPVLQGKLAAITTDNQGKRGPTVAPSSAPPHVGRPALGRNSGDQGCAF